MRLPRHVRAFRRSGEVRGYRAVVSIGEGRRWYGPVRSEPSDAGGDAARYLAAVGRDASGVTMRRALELLAVDLDRSGARPSTEKFYRGHYRALVAHWPEDTPLATLTPGQVLRFAEARRMAGVSASTVWGKDVVTLRRLVGVALRRGLLRDDPLTGLETPHVRQGRFHALTAEAVLDIVRRMRESGLPAAERDATVVELMFATGLRRAELGRVRRSDVDLDGRVLHVDGKTGDRTIPLEGLGLRAMRSLCRGRAGADLVGPHPDTVTTLFYRWKMRLGLRHFSPHVMRHSFATDAVRRGVQPFVLATLMGHVGPKQTFRYYSSSGDEVRQAMRAIGGHAESPPHNAP